MGRNVMIVMLVLASSIGDVSANMAKPWEGGDRAGDPVGIKDVAITHEELVIDLRPMVDRGGLAKVSATYHLDNGGPDKPLDLVFAMGSQATAFRVTLDGAEITSTVPSDAPLPESWQPPKTTPGLDGAEVNYHLDNPFLSVAFQVVVPAGRHEIAVTYNAEPVQSSWSSVLQYQFAYVLSPARSWASFGGLDITVLVPEDWNIAMSPALKREGDTLRGSFATVPADAVALTMRVPTMLYSVVGVVSLIVFALVALGGAVLLGWRTRVVERRRLAAHQFPSGLAAFGRGFAWAAAFFVTGLFAVVGPALTIPGQDYHRGYGQAFAVVGVVLGTILVLFIGWIVSHVVGRRVHLPKQAAEKDN